jgi:uncharacterized protein (TIGR00255 family)
MTGYGRASAQEDNWTLTWEIRSLNNRHLDLKWKSPPTLYAHQKQWENEVKAVANRGGVELFLGLKINNPELQSLTLDATMAASMLRELDVLARSLGVPHTPDLNRLMGISSLWKDAGSIENPELISSLTETLTKEEDLRARFARLGELVSEIRELASQTAPERFALLQERVGKILAESGVQVDPDRMLQELAVISDRIDVSEELTRLEIHLRGIDTYFRQTEPVGRKLDFMVQECFREINTCGNKSQNTAISQLVVTFKAELEKCREQIQNLE